MSLTRKEKTMSDGSVLIDTSLNNKGLEKGINNIEEKESSMNEKVE